MASAFTHAAVAGTLVYALRPATARGRLYAAAALCAIAPDFDVVGFQVGIEYGDLLGHRGLSHSLAVAVIAGVVMAWWVRRGTSWTSAERVRATLALVLATASHGALDALTDGGLGIAFFSPFDATRYFFAWQPIRVSPIGIADFFSPWGWEVMQSEFVVVWIPCALLAASVALARRLRRGA